MNINHRESGDCRVVDLEGNLDTSTAPQLEAEMDQLIEQNPDKVVVNLADLNYVSSAGLRVFLKTAKQLIARKGSFALAAPNETVREILKISGFDTILEVVDSVEG